MKKLGLLFDCLRSPYDVAHIIQVATALGNCELYLTGNCIDIENRKIVSKVRSWNIRTMPLFRKFSSLEEAAMMLHKEDKFLVGTSPHASNDLYSVDLTNRLPVFVFGTESTGLTPQKIQLLDYEIKIPMQKECPFLTLPVAVPIIAYEFYRQTHEKNNGGDR